MPFAVGLNLTYTIGAANTASTQTKAQKYLHPSSQSELFSYGLFINCAVIITPADWLQNTALDIVPTANVTQYAPNT